ncbi:MAG: type II toxin-antitoxin system VapC family toxin [Anaerolineales bacterium]|nr:type II toxin-antitoxin system VapC family toxin [Anaerolineales bacterium]
MILLDTNVLSELMRPQPNAAVVRWVDDQLTSTLFTSAVTRAEIELGLALLPDSRRKQTLTMLARDLFAKFPQRCLPFEERAAVHYGRIVASRIRTGRPMSVEDAQIAAIALANGLRLATRNEKDFAEISDLVVFNPWHLE